MSLLRKRTAKADPVSKVMAAPPPARQAPRRLSLKTAIAAATRREGADVQPLFSPIDEFPNVKTKSGKQQEMEARLLELQAEIIVREDEVSQRERRVAARELELNEREALLEAHRKLLEAKPGASTNTAPTGAAASSEAQSEELKALRALQKELEAQEASLCDARAILREREAFIEECENQLVERSLLLTEREARVEQDEEDAEADRHREAGKIA
jgi:hypothetical protein